MPTLVGLWVEERVMQGHPFDHGHIGTEYVGWWVPWFINKEGLSSKIRDAPNELVTQKIAML